MLSRRTLQPMGKAGRQPALVRRYSVALKKHLSSNVVMKEQPIVEQKKSLVQILLPYLLFFLNILVGSAVVYVCEILDAQVHDSRTKENDSLCVLTHGFFGSLFYVMSATSTVGYGVLYPCTISGKIFGAIFSLLGVPLALRMLNDLGGKMYTLGIHMMIKYRERQAAKGTHPFGATSGEEPTGNGPVKFELSFDYNRNSEDELDELLLDDKAMEIYDIPAWVGIVLSLTCIFVCGMFYMIAEQYDFMESVYYSLLTYITGDLVTSHFPLVLPIFFFIFLGFGMFSLALHLIHGNIENAIKRIRKRAKILIKKLRRDIEGGVIEPEDLDIDEIVEVLIEKSTNVVTRVFVPESVAAEFRDIFFDSAFRVSRGTTAVSDPEKKKPVTTKISSGTQTSKSKQSTGTITMTPLQNRVVSIGSLTNTLETCDSLSETAGIERCSSVCQAYATSDAECQEEVTLSEGSCEPYIVRKVSARFGHDKTYQETPVQWDGDKTSVEIQTMTPKAPMPVKYEWEIFAARRRAEVKRARKTRSASCTPRKMSMMRFHQNST